MRVHYKFPTLSRHCVRLFSWPLDTSGGRKLQGKLAIQVDPFQNMLLAYDDDYRNYCPGPGKGQVSVVIIPRVSELPRSSTFASTGAL